MFINKGPDEAATWAAEAARALEQLLPSLPGQEQGQKILMRLFLKIDAGDCFKPTDWPDYPTNLIDFNQCLFDNDANDLTCRKLKSP